LYRDNLKVYFGIACRATLWALLPFVILIPIPLVLIYDQANPAILGLLIPAGLVLFVYGMAKYMVNSALISRLAFCELTNQPESARDARRQVSPKLWIFLRAYLLFLLLSFGIWIGFYLIALVLGILGGFLAVSVQDNMAILVVLGLIAIILFGIALSVIIRIFTRLFMYEVPLAIEEDITASQTIQRSWSLTKNHVGRVFLTLTVAFLISIPIYIIVQIIVSILQGVLLRVVAAEPTSVGFQILSIIVGYVLGLVSGALLLPFWQAIKAVVYYDLRSRREGLGMQLR
jgi:membrane-anchored glycerophosphoryl diester phosphodiesterase (GDPDase)